MKRFLTIVFLLIVFINVSSCTSSLDDNNSDIDFSVNSYKPEAAFSEDFGNRFGRGYESIIETGDAYYYCPFSGDYAYYYDKSGGVYGVLCPKPECRHDEAEAQNRSCSGYIDCHATSFFLSDGKLYYVSHLNVSDFKGPALFCMNPDGTGKEAVRKLDFGETQNICWPQRYDLHRGKLYGWIEYEKVENGEPAICFKVMSIDIETGNCRTIYEKSDCGTSIAPAFFFLDDSLYFSVPDQGPAPSTSSLEIFRWDIEKGSLEKLYSSGAGGVHGGMFDIWVEDDGSIWLVPKGINTGESSEVSIISNGELQTAFVFQDFGSAHLIDGGAVNVTFPEREIIVADREGNILKRIEKDLSFLDEIDCSVDASRYSLGIYGDINELFVVFDGLRFEHEDGSSGSGSCLVRYDLTEDEPQAQLLAVSPWD